MNKKVLIIEDEAFIRDLYYRILTQQGYTVLLAEDGEIGFTMAKEHPDLILLDIMLPKFNGIELLKKLLTDTDTIKVPVVVLTNLGQDEIINQCFQLGAVGYLMKSKTTPEQVVAAVKDYLARGAAH